MIPVKPQPAPPIAAQVQTDGLAWLVANGIDPKKPKPETVELKPLWRQCLPELHKRYEGVCAYLCVYFEHELGASTVDHFVAQKHHAGGAYEWSNYRLACRTMNTNKSVHRMLDPFLLAPDTFRMRFLNGEIYPNPGLTGAASTQATHAITELELDAPNMRAMRVRHFERFLKLRGTAPNAAAEQDLRTYSPFVWTEAKRQGLL